MGTIKKIFLYLYPIEEYTKTSLRFCGVIDYLEQKRLLSILDECIQKRYRDKGYEVVFALYPDKELFGLTKKEQDRVILTDIDFLTVNTYANNNDEKKDYAIKYPSELHIVEQLGGVSELVVGGYHATDCVRKVAETASKLGIKTLVDLDLTEYFFNLYKEENYFRIDEYSPARYYNRAKDRAKYNCIPDDMNEEMLKRLFSSDVYGIYNKHKDNIRN